jgi:ribosomal protein L40E
VPMEAPPLYRAPRAPAAWPPIGASWPARETPGAPWLGPEAPSVPAAMVAREASLPVLAGMWAQSAQEVLSRGSVRVCHRCALPVSTQARFCRRCGTKQA